MELLQHSKQMARYVWITFMVLWRKCSIDLFRQKFATLSRKNNEYQHIEVIQVKHENDTIQLTFFVTKQQVQIQNLMILIPHWVIALLSLILIWAYWIYLVFLSSVLQISFENNVTKHSLEKPAKAEIEIAFNLDFRR